VATVSEHVSQVKRDWLRQEVYRQFPDLPALFWGSIYICHSTIFALAVFLLRVVCAPREPHALTSVGVVLIRSFRARRCQVGTEDRRGDGDDLGGVAESRQGGWRGGAWLDEAFLACTPRR
jgi:hypothetical protein